MNNTFEQLIINEDGDITVEQKKFVELHKEIIFCGNTACDFAMRMAAKLKEMRDSRLFATAGFDNFSSYVETAVGIKERQAYNYIKVYEDLPESFLHSNAKIGITKLLLLAGTEKEYRDDIVENADLESISVRELKERVKELENKNEQLQFDLDNAAPLIETTPIAGIDGARAEIESKVSAEYEKKINAAVAAAEKEFKAKSADEIKELKEKAKAAQANAKAEADKFKAAEEKAKKAEAEAEQARKDAADIPALRAQIEAANEKNTAMEKQIKVSANPELTRFKFLFEDAQNSLNALINQYQKLDGETQLKMKTAINKMLEAIAL